MILSIGSIVIAFALVVVTYLYMRHSKRLADDTKRMADTMAQEFELRIAPFIWVDQLPRTRGINSREYRPIITNKGFLPVHIMKIILEGWPKGSPSKVFRKEAKIDKVLGRNEYIKYGECVITLRKTDVSIGASEESKDFDFNQLLNSSEGKIYFTYVDKDGKEQKTGDRYFEYL